MPKSALIADPKKREIAIAVLMGLILTGSLLLVVVLTGAPLLRGGAASDAPADHASP
ncbi:hypothetical protein OT109_16560 [Phycisphaeraceae bacterium D3-23]